MKNVSFSILFILFISMLCSRNYAQSMCSITTLKTNSVKGKVLWNDKPAQPIVKTKVELKRLDETQSLVSSVLTDNLGFFEIGNIKKGEYVLDTWLYVDEKPYFAYRIGLKVKKTNDTKSKSLIVVKLGLDCWNSEVSVAKSTAISNK